MSNSNPTPKTYIDSAVGGAVVDYAAGKKWYLSKTFWTNIVAAAALGVQFKLGFIVGPEYQALLLAFVNLGLRKITKEPVFW